MRVYFVRHGESYGNANHHKSGFSREDADKLTKQGHAQAIRLGERLKNEGIQRIISSPMRRARETAAGITKTLDLPVEIDDVTFEVRSADSFHQTEIERRQPFVAHLFMAEHADDPDYRIDGSESFNDALKRAKAFLKKLGTLGDESVLVVTHADFLRFLAGCILLGDQFGPADFNRLWGLKAINTGITIFEYREMKPVPGYPERPWRIATWMDHAHL